MTYTNDSLVALFLLNIRFQRLEERCSAVPTNEVEYPTESSKRNNQERNRDKRKGVQNLLSNGSGSCDLARQHRNVGEVKYCKELSSKIDRGCKDRYETGTLKLKFSSEPLSGK